LFELSEGDVWLRSCSGRLFNSVDLAVANSCRRTGYLISWSSMFDCQQTAKDGSQRW